MFWSDITELHGIRLISYLELHLTLTHNISISNCTHTHVYVYIRTELKLMFWCENIAAVSVYSVSLCNGVQRLSVQYGAQRVDLISPPASPHPFSLWFDHLSEISILKPVKSRSTGMERSDFAVWIINKMWFWIFKCNVSYPMYVKPSECMFTMATLSLQGPEAAAGESE